MLKLQYKFLIWEVRTRRVGSRAIMPRHSQSDLNMLDDHLLMHMGYNPSPSRPARALRYPAQVCPAFQDHSRTGTDRRGRAPRMGPVSADGGRLQETHRRTTWPHPHILHQHARSTLPHAMRRQSHLAEPIHLAPATWPRILERPSEMGTVRGGYTRQKQNG